MGTETSQHGETETAVNNNLNRNGHTNRGRGFHVALVLKGELKAERSGA